MMKKLVCLILVLAMAGIASAGQTFTGNVDTKWATVGNWSAGHVPNDSTTPPGSYVPQWGNDVGVGADALMEIGASEDWHSYSFQIGLYGADNAQVDISGGSLTVGSWGIDVGRGNSGHGPMDGTLNVTGGNLRTSAALQVPQYWNNTGVTSDCVGVLNASGGVISAGFMRIGMGDGVGTVNLSGNAAVGLATALQMNTFWGGWDEPSLAMTASLVIDDDAFIAIGGVGDYTPGPGDPTVEETLQAEMDLYQAYIDFGWISSNTGTVTVSYIENADLIIIPEPATMMLLGVGGLLLRRKVKG